MRTTGKAVRINSTILRAMGACEEAIEKFQVVFPRGTVINSVSIVEAIKAELPLSSIMHGLGVRAPYLQDHNLEGVNLPHDIGGWLFNNCILRHCMLRHGYGVHADFSRSTLDWAMFDSSNLEMTNFTRCSARNASFSEANLTGSYMKNLQASYAKFNSAILHRATLRCANVFGANMRFAAVTLACCSLTNFSNANCSGAKFTGSYMRDANFDYADLTGADFTRADVCGTSFIDAEGLNLAGAINADQAILR